MQFGGGPVYSEVDIVRGKRVLRNGAVAGYVKTHDGSVKWRIVKGIPKSAMAGLRAQRRRNNGKDGKAPSAARCAKANPPLGCPLSREDAKKAFESHYRRDYMHNDARRAKHAAPIHRKHPELTDRQLAIRTNKSLRRSMRAAKTRDAGHQLPKHRIVSDMRFKNHPGEYDYPGVDDGIYPVVHRGSSAAQKAAAKKNIAKARGARGKGSGAAKNQNQNQNQNQRQNQQGGQRPVSLKTAVQLLRDYYREAY